MPVIIDDIEPFSPAYEAGIKPGSKLVMIDGFPIDDALDYMFYGDEDMGFIFNSPLMSDKKPCKNKCMFCFIDQLPKADNPCLGGKPLRQTLYFKDDDSRLSFLLGNYVTLTNLSEGDVDRIIKMKTPINVSVHTTNPELRSKMMGNKNAGKALDYLYRICSANIPVNCQLVLCPKINDGDELLKTLSDLSGYSSIESIALVPVGITRFRDNLTPIQTFTREESVEVIKASSLYDNVFAADEFYLKAEMPFPDYESYGAFSQYENGVGMWTYFEREFEAAKKGLCDDINFVPTTIITGAAAFPLITGLVKNLSSVNVIEVVNHFFGETITVSGLLTGQDIIKALVKAKDENKLATQILIPENTLNADKVFLDDLTLSDIEKALNVSEDVSTAKFNVKTVPCDGGELINTLYGLTS